MHSIILKLFLLAFPTASLFSIPSVMLIISCVNVWLLTFQKCKISWQSDFLCELFYILFASQKKTENSLQLRTPWKLFVDSLDRDIVLMNKRETRYWYSPSKWIQLVTGSHTFHNDIECHRICIVITLIAVEDSKLSSGWHKNDPITPITSLANSGT